MFCHMNCKQCGTKLTSRWQHRFCSRSCFYAWSKGKPSRSPLTTFSKGVRPSPATEFKKGQRSWNYIEDRSQLKKSHEESKYRNSPAHKEWSKNVKTRDGWKCRIADNNCEGKLVAHHILSWSEFTELRYQVNNGIALCHAHHPRQRAEEKRLAPIFLDLVTVSSN